ncbi:4'-phosphopantetheinyl transferase superfamily protein [Streptomyces tuirus]|uniref:4'-phosphopantetheinyl transferase superfamily protein n=1 Tax=Streptomyces tuirus TaxID=68278 RepID=A0A941J0C3_9ACTN|nr:4'-phosphopantetheinyl transferase superfamily protein [Streptomyces tuirus]
MSSRITRPWSDGPQHPRLADGDVDIWHLTLPSSWNSSCDELFGLLDQREQDRARQMPRPADQASHVVAHAGLRDVLGRYLGAAPQSLRFSTGRHGKPYLADTRLSFSLSHTTGGALVAVSIPGPVGVDVESATGPDRSALADRFFSPREAQVLRTTPESDVPSRFLTYWTCKESFVKALGLGLSHPLNRFEIRFTDAPRQAEIWSAGRRRDEWHVRQLELPPPYVGAVTVRHRPRHLRTWTWRPQSVARPALPTP